MVKLPFSTYTPPPNFHDSPPLLTQSPITPSFMVKLPPFWTSTPPAPLPPVQLRMLPPFMVNVLRATTTPPPRLPAVQPMMLPPFMVNVVRSIASP